MDLDVVDERVDHGIALDGVERAGKCGRREAAEQNAYDESCTRNAQELRTGFPTWDDRRTQ